MKFTRLLLFFYFLLNVPFVFCQKSLETNVQVILKSNFSNEAKINTIQKELLQFANYSDTPEAASVYYELGILFFKTNAIENSKLFFEKSIAIFKKNKKKYLPSLNKSRYYLSWLYMNTGKKKEYYTLLKEIVNDKGNDVNTLNALISLVMMDCEKGDYYLGLKRLQFKLAQKNSIADEVTLRIRIIEIYAQMVEDNSKNAIRPHILIIKTHQNFIEQNFKKSELAPQKLYEFYNNLANIYESLGEYPTALHLYLQSKTFFKEQQNEQEYFFVLNNIGYLYARQNQIDLASKCFTEIIHRATDRNQIATAYDNLGYFSKIKATEKILFFQKAIQTTLAIDDQHFSLPSIEKIKESGHQQDILVYLVDLAYYYVEAYRITPSKTFLFQAKEVLYRIDALVSIIRYESTSEQSKLFWIEKGVNTYLLGAQVCYLLNSPAEGFYFMEKNKALLLQENIKTIQAKLELQVPLEVREQEFKLHYEMLVAEQKYQQFPNNAAFKVAYLKKHKEFDRFITVLTRNYPQYARLKQKIDIVSLSHVIASLDQEACFVTYILNDNKGYGLFANKTGSLFFEIQHVATLQKNIQALKTYNSQFLLDQSKRIDLQKTSASVFHSLFPFRDALNNIKNKKLTILADDCLLNLPFESLCVGVRNRLQDSYLIHFSEISYLQSFSTFEKIKQWKNKASKKLLVTVPFQFKDLKLPTLTRSKEVINACAKYNSSTLLFATEATKANFCATVADYQILHINTHAGVAPNNKMPWLAFSDTKMTLQELYGIPNQAELVILDACKTNDGQLESGEGIISLSRGFFMNGAKSVLASLWNVNEKTGNAIISSFYSELEKGNSKSKALQLAKINYLQQHQYSEVLPYYWASFTLTGSTTSITLSQKWYYNKGIVLLVTVIFVIISGLIIKLWYFKK